MRLPVETIHESLSSLSVATLASKNNSVTGRKHREPEAAVEAEDFSRFEGEGGQEGPIPDPVDVPLDNAIWRGPRWGTHQTNPADP